ncbi:MAG TPA: hypothetical protein DEG17_20795 [Cyanobacteria bacterium UBA11149]|nr:hypothetical protein [Cyanobacteria bacterium UBA11367]HBE58721.1 hypothetical protein [Cyanobacteria bacterium UBA11366]HBK63318.1 hypothetical protein [Cyanobacteria bacterium UBA11166]HBR76481.1 hypothetical protein [Cyanobacteria bacterium UBA11159]HBS69266.1 hypothetical protein [Cyanobacteria bacterium UBA11153]HBW91232.1 hypothetical protein [Cyanobacteria bacterium UBA11149]HCA97387.1 hypothetical protein [Cyanobacteria bacterium UBA9226]
MADSLENEFLDLVRKRRKNKRTLILKRIGAIVLIAIGSSVLGYWLFHRNVTFNIGNFVVSPMLIGLVAIFFIMGLLVYAAKNLTFNKTHHKLSDKPTKRTLIKRKYLLGYSLLILAIIIQVNPWIINNHLNGLIPRLIYNPQPPTSNSPWPWPNQKMIHPVVAGMTEDIEKSIKSVAEYIDKKEPNPYLKIKALHDYVISRVTYDLDVLKTGRRPRQDAQTVFLTHKGVCEGYANLFKALGQAIGIDVVYILGKIRQDLAPVDVIPENIRLLKSNYDWTNHAWNAVKVEGNWQLVDTTWDDTNSGNSAESYHGNYLMLPPKAMIMSHLPQQEDWQLLHKVETDTSFEKQPILAPQFFAENLTIVSPTEYQTTIEKTAIIDIILPPNYPKKIVAMFSRIKEKETEFPLWKLPKQEEKPKLEQCHSQDNRAKTMKIYCNFSQPGIYQVNLFSMEYKNNSPSQGTNPLGKLKFQVISYPLKQSKINLNSGG